jgi:prophage maintenance system killer protein
MKYIDAGDFFLIAAEALGRPVEEIVDQTNFARLSSALAPPALVVDGIDAFPSVAEKAAVMCARIARNRPLPRDNTTVAFAVMRAFLELNNVTWSYPPGGVDEVTAVMEALARGEMPEAQFVLWIDQRLA